MSSNLSGLARKVGIYRIALALVGILGISAAILSLTDVGSESTPSLASYNPSGASAFAELLRQSGYKVSSSYSTRPTLNPGDVAISFMLADRGAFSNRTSLQGKEEIAKSTTEMVANQVSDGANAIFLQVPENFQSAAPEVRDTAVSQLAGNFPKGTVSIRSTEREPAFVNLHEKRTEIMDLGLIEKATPFAKFVKVGKGFMIQPVDGMLATNRYIDKADNAQVLMSLVSLLAKPGSRVVFTEGTWGNASPPSLIESIGPWAIGIWRQLIFLGVVVIVTLGRRFGIGSETRRSEQGTKELVDAVSGIYQRAKATRPALQTAVIRAENAIRGRLKLSKEASIRELCHLLPTSLESALANARKLTEYETGEDDALRATRVLDRELQHFLAKS